MKIDITKKQFESLMMAIDIVDTVVGLLSDAYDGEDGKRYKERVKRVSELRNVLYSRAKEFGLEEVVEEYKGEWYISEDSLKKEEHEGIMDDFEEWVVQDVLSHRLGNRDFYRTHTQEEMEKVVEEHDGYLGVETYTYEEKYWKEFEEHGYDRLEIVERVREK